MCLQCIDLSRTMIGSFVPVLSDERFKREVSLSLQDIHSVLLLSSLLCQANRMRSCRQTDGQQWAGGGGMKHTKEFLADHYLTHRLGKAISTSNQFFLSSCTSILSQQILSVSDTEISKEPRTWEEITKNIQPASNQVLPTHYAPYE